MKKGTAAPKYRSGFTGADRAACVRKPQHMSVVAKLSPISATAESLLFIDVVRQIKLAMRQL